MAIIIPLRFSREGVVKWRTSENHVSLLSVCYQNGAFSKIFLLFLDLNGISVSLISDLDYLGSIVSRTYFQIYFTSLILCDLKVIGR